MGRGERRREKGQTRSPLLLRTKQKNCIREGEGRESERVREGERERKRANM